MHHKQLEHLSVERERERARGREGEREGERERETKRRQSNTETDTVCPRSSYTFYIVSYCIKRGTTSWTYSRNTDRERHTHRDRTQRK